ncbi:MAG: acyl-CoA dehydratase activase [Spirochaetia bacterium]
MPDAAFLGVDIGSVSISTALVSRDGRVLCAAYGLHGGKVRETLRGQLAGLGSALVAAVGCTPSAASLIRGVRPVDSQVALIAASRRLFPGARSILHVGGEKFVLIRLGAQGQYLGTRSNSSCAAGTGSFLDQQARRLGFAGVQELDLKARASTSTPPRISTRCAVFARTDLVHAQQEGYSLPEICDGLCKGVAQTIADTLAHGEPLDTPAVFTGGVSLNCAVRAHLELVLGVTLEVSRYGSMAVAIGAAFCAGEHAEQASPASIDPDGLLAPTLEKKDYYYPPLPCDDEDQSRNRETRLFQAGTHSRAHPVEVEEFGGGRASELSVCLGIDVGSTSTKAMLIGEDREPVAGFYTRTLGSPLTAVQALCEAMEDFAHRSGAVLAVTGVATTGAGRKFIGSIIRADLVIDEITAHARAAYSLDPDIDTIIEIGGQDAKFTTMRDGMVTFSHMNTVCAAGTGSFLEEQAARLGCELSDYSRRVRGARAPLSSDRCAVFMERDINNFLSQGFSSDEILAAALYSVRENYLQKVARGASIGKKVAFQGATARNRALVAVFQQGLGAPVLVSRYCHLAGALGAALLLSQGNRATTTFPGFPALRGNIPVRSETCQLCANACRLRTVLVGGDEVAYGFLCGRDYNVGRFVDRNRSGFDLMKERRKAFKQEGPAPQPTGPVIGVPAALGLYADLPFWKAFFSSLGLRVVTSEGLKDAIEEGRKAHGADFCAPLAALRGHVDYLLSRADWIFLPVQLEEARRGSRLPRVYCYYTQYSAALACSDPRQRRRCLMPNLSWTRRPKRTLSELHAMLVAIGLAGLSHARVNRAFRDACVARERAIAGLQQRFREELARSDGPAVVLLGRPYNVLSPEMSKGIPELFAAQGVKTFSQDMVPYGQSDVEEIAPLLEQVHWHHAARILEVACVVANTPGLYSVYLTSFKCSPDSIAVEYFRRLMDARGKPYLVLQLDDHDSTLGYETRIEAGVVSFRNHRARTRRLTPVKSPLPFNPRLSAKLDGRTLLFPVWDPIVNPLLAACLRREGVDARVLDEDPLVIRKAMRHNTGQCIPLNVIAEEAMQYVESHGLDPARTALWMARSLLSCNIGMFPPYIKSLMEARGGGMERVQVFAGSAFYLDFSLRASINAYRAYLAGGLLRRLGCRLRPYETEPGATDRAMSQSLEILLPAFEGSSSMDDALRRAASLFTGIRTEGANRPKVAIFGDFYVRDNDIMNQGLISCLEDAGGEVITTSYTEYVRIVARSYFRKWREAGEYVASYRYRALWKLVQSLGGAYRRHFEPILGKEPPIADDDPELIMREFGVRSEHAGESFDNLLKVHHLAAAYPDLALFVQASPAFCCPSLVTEAMGRDIERLTGVPVVSITYDGTGQYRNDAVVPYLRYAAGRARASLRLPPERSA